MKQKLTRALIDEIRKEMPVLTEMEMRCCNGGDGGTVSWDCLFIAWHFSFSDSILLLEECHRL